jgi:hypothetical protein
MRQLVVCLIEWFKFSKEKTMTHNNVKRNNKHLYKRSYAFINYYTRKEVYFVHHRKKNPGNEYSMVCHLRFVHFRAS